MLLLINYFQGRKMTVKWKGAISRLRELPGGGPQGAPLGQLSYKSQSNDNANHVAVNDRYKFVDDLSILEKVDLIAIGLASYDFRNHVASDIPTDHKFLPAENIHSQKIADQLLSWTNEKKMKLNSKNSNLMIFNFTQNHQFHTRVNLENASTRSTEGNKTTGVHHYF